VAQFEPDEPEESRTHAPQCQNCGETVRFARFQSKYGREPSETFPKGIPPGGTVEGWSHWHGMKVGHQAEPPPGVTGESYLIRREAAMDQARMHVRAHLQRSFDYLNAQNQVNALFNDRREGNGA